MTPSTSRPPAIPRPTTTTRSGGSGCRATGSGTGDRHGADLELRHPADGVERVVGQRSVGRRPSGTARRPCRAGSVSVTRAGAVASPRRVRDRDAGRRRRRRSGRRASGCSSTNGPVGRGSSRDPAGLGAGLVLREHPAGRRGGRGTSASDVARPAAVLDGDATGRGRRACANRSSEQPRRARVGPVGVPGTARRRRARRVDPVVGDAGVVGAAARRGPAELVEDRPRVGREVDRRRRAASARPASTSRSVRTPVAAARSTARRRRITRPSRLVIVPLLLGPLRRRAARRRRARRSRDSTMSQTTSRSRAAQPRRRRGSASGRGDDDVASRSTSSAAGRPAVPSASSSSYAERPGPGQRRRGRRPRPRATCARAAGSSIIAVAGQLVGLLAVLAAALAVALAGEAAVAGARPCPGSPSASARLIQAVHGVGALARAARRRGR